ncbi:MAG TPA: hypothetical protein VGB79_10325 [Allosphingosinicella sp.]
MGAELQAGSPVPPHRFDDLKRLSGLPLDIAAARGVPITRRRELVAHARRRQRGCLLARLYDPVEGVAEVTFDLALYDVGVAIVHDLSLFTDGAEWSLVGRPGDVLFRLTSDGMIPTLTPPWTYAGINPADAGRQRWTGIAAAEQLAAAYIWSI